MYVIQASHGRYVAPRGSHHAYVRDLAEARKYPTRKDAERDCCVGNERVISLYELLSRGF